MTDQQIKKATAFHREGRSAVVGKLRFMAMDTLRPDLDRAFFREVADLISGTLEGRRPTHALLNERPDDMNDEKLNQQYRDEGWGILAEAAGFNPVNTESAAREAFRFCWDILTEDQRAKLNPRKGGVAIPEPH